MNDLAVAREHALAVTRPPASRLRVSAREWPAWLSPMLQAARDEDLAAARTLHDALAALAAVESAAEPESLELAVARQQAFLARRAWRTRVEQLAGPKAQWCGCGPEAAPPP